MVSTGLIFQKSKILNQLSKIPSCSRNCKLISLLLSTMPLFASANEKVDNKTQARRPASY